MTMTLRLGLRTARKCRAYALQAATLELLSQKLQVMIPELLENIPSDTKIHLEVHGERCVETSWIAETLLSGLPTV